MNFKTTQISVIFSFLIFSLPIFGSDKLNGIVEETRQTIAQQIDLEPNTHTSIIDYNKYFSDFLRVLTSDQVAILSKIAMPKFFHLTEKLPTSSYFVNDDWFYEFDEKDLISVPNNNIYPEKLKDYLKKNSYITMININCEAYYRSLTSISFNSKIKICIETSENSLDKTSASGFWFYALAIHSGLPIDQAKKAKTIGEKIYPIISRPHFKALKTFSYTIQQDIAYASNTILESMLGIINEGKMQNPDSIFQLRDKLLKLFSMTQKAFFLNNQYSWRSNPCVNNESRPSFAYDQINSQLAYFKMAIHETMERLSTNKAVSSNMHKNFSSALGKYLDMTKICVPNS